jgi:hypothetical protein
MKVSKIVIALTLFAALTVAIFPIYNVQATETLVWAGSVSSNGTPVTTPTLVLGVNYRILVSPGIMYLGPNTVCDAEYYAVSPVDGWVWLSGTRPGSHSFLQIDDDDVEWGAFSNGQPGYPPYLGHTYEIHYVGTDAPIEFSIHDWIDGIYAENSCHLEIAILREEGAGFTPGFWKHNIQVAMGRSTGSFSSFFEDGPHLTQSEVEGYVATAGYASLQAALTELTAKGPGSEIRRVTCANALNAAAGFGPFVDYD